MSNDTIILAIAASDADFDGRPFHGLGKADRDRYTARAAKSWEVARQHQIAKLDNELNSLAQAPATQLIAALTTNSPASRARHAFSSEAARLEQSSADPIAMRRSEFTAVGAVIKTYLASL